jgi:hypothetical protein
MSFGGFLLPHIKMAPVLMTRTGHTPIWLTDDRSQNDSDPACVTRHSC